MNKIKLLVIDDNSSLVKMIEEYFSKTTNIEVSFVANNGEDGIDLINKHQEEVDLILLDLVMPKVDGIEVLQYLKEKGIDKKVIVLTSYNSQEMIRKVSELGANYFMLKPFELTTLRNKIEKVYGNSENSSENLDYFQNNLQISISKTLHELGVPSHIKGYQYIREGITLLFKNPDYIGGITKELYPTIAKTFDSTASRVERAIRHAIDISWNRANWDLMVDLFGYTVDIDGAKPTNSEFIVTIADKLRLEFNQQITNILNYFFHFEFYIQPFLLIFYLFSFELIDIF